jgi:hypothetical protein
MSTVSVILVDKLRFVAAARPDGLSDGQHAGTVHR